MTYIGPLTSQNLFILLTTLSYYHSNIESLFDLITSELSNISDWLTVILILS